MLGFQFIVFWSVRAGGVAMVVVYGMCRVVICVAARRQNRGRAENRIEDVIAADR